MKSQVYPLGKNAHEQSNHSREESRIKMALRQVGENPRSTQRVPTTKVNIEGEPAPHGSRAPPAWTYFLSLLKFGGAIFLRARKHNGGTKFEL